MSLRWKIVLALVAITTATTIAVGAISYRTTQQRLVQEIDRSLRSATATFVRTGKPPVPGGPLDAFVVQYVNREGDVSDTSADDPIGPGPGAMRVAGRPREVAYETLETTDGDVRLRSEGLTWGALQVARSMDETERVLDDVRQRTILLVAVVATAAAALGWIIASTVAAPLTRLTAAATDVERSGRLDVDVPVRGRDEAGRLGTAFNRMLGALAASRADQQRLVQDAGHELRTPLTSVRTNLAVLRRYPDLAPEVRATVLDDLDAETEQLVVLVEEVVALASGAADESPPETFVLAEAADAVVERARRRSGREIHLVADHATVTAPRPAVERAISNLVDNALKFDVAGGPIDVTVRAGRVDVADRGPGIGDADLERVFDRFHRAEAARAMPGSGLGLAIVRDVAERGGGGVHAARRDGGGAEVGFWLPVVEAPPLPT